MRLTVGNRITYSFVLVVVLTAGLGAFTYRDLHSISNLIPAIEDDALPGELYSVVISNLLRQDGLNSMRRLMSTDPAIAAKLEDNIRQVSGEIDKELVKLIPTLSDATDRRDFETTKRCIAEYRE